MKIWFWKKGSWYFINRLIFFVHIIFCYITEARLRPNMQHRSKHLTLLRAWGDGRASLRPSKANMSQANTALEALWRPRWRPVQPKRKFVMLKLISLLITTLWAWEILLIVLSDAIFSTWDCFNSFKNKEKLVNPSPSIVRTEKLLQMNKRFTEQRNSFAM